MRCLLALLLLLVVVGCGSKTGLTVPEVDAGPCSDEICNGLDDDCDGAADDGLACFFLDGEPIDSLQTRRCGSSWYSYDTPDSQSANPRPDIRVSGGVVVAIQHGDSCAGAGVAVIADLPDDGSGGELNGRFTVTPPSAARLVVSDEPDECLYDVRTGVGSCEWIWVNCCTDGVMLGPIETEGCVTMTLSDPLGVSTLEVLDGPDDRVARSFGVPFELCTQIRPAVR